MIYETMKFLSDEINAYLSGKLGVNTDPRLILGNVSKALDNDTTGPNSLNGKAVLTLVNVEEDRIAKQQENYFKNNTSVVYKNPPIYINLYLLISINKAEYADALKWLAYIIQFFQYQNVFTPLSHPDLDPRIIKLITDLYTLNFEQINHLWSTLGGKYLPSVMYKVRQITLDEDAVVAGGGLITEINVNSLNQQAVS
ncbi:DUF4255 domain-containing protein [Mucilaginibacter jinjuensis]|uniref:DUF4255 domain-containing protein n=1 Tax=Mucilaginibacter jinjuensis TaxID=1176721 RepID=A0ABY7T1R3_9SPHI|nr:DUF4255 domain-containing protein [Mucilaginibacter jinjuensis]WCT10385.1 DUF4255 domain-containing protein [Mucilaginibacter jinjuensis]